MTNLERFRCALLLACVRAALDRRSVFVITDEDDFLIEPIAIGQDWVCVSPDGRATHASGSAIELSAVEHRNSSSHVGANRVERFSR